MKRNYYIGDEWLYYKIYCGKNTANEILTNSIFSVTQDLIKKELIDKWFFIRYEDPDFHLRLRFHLRTTDALHYIINLLKSALKKYLDHQIIWKLQIENYSREIERYGEKNNR